MSGGYADSHGDQPRAGNRARVITITAPKGGTGKSSLTLNLAAYCGMRLREAGKRVALIDVNIQQSDSGKYLGLLTPNVLQLLHKGTMNIESVLSSMVHRESWNLSVLLGPDDPRAANPAYLTPEVYNTILDAMLPHFHYIFIDTPVAELYHPMLSQFAIPRADALVVPVTPNNIALLNSRAWLQALTADPAQGGQGVPTSKVWIVLNRAEEEVGVDAETVRRSLAQFPFAGSIPETAAWKRANNAFELVAARNYADLSAAFSQILEAVTGEPFTQGLQGVAAGGGGLGARLRRIFGR